MAALALSSSSQLLQRGLSSSSAAPRQAAAAARGAPLVVRAQAPKLPKGATLPPRKPEVPSPMVGFVYNAERLNSRAAMIGFFGLLLVELIANRGILDLLGVTTGKGLPFEL